MATKKNPYAGGHMSTKSPIGHGRAPRALPLPPVRSQSEQSRNPLPAAGKRQGSRTSNQLPAAKRGKK
jgi:hypothetical protein